MANKPLDAHVCTKQGLSKLTKEEILEIISNLKHMPTAVAMKAVENIPGYFNICKETIQSIISINKDNMELSKEDAKKLFDSFDSRRTILEEKFREAKTQDEMDYYSKKLDEIDKKKDELRDKLEKERKDRLKEVVGSLLLVVFVAGGAVGIGVKFSKR